MRLGTHTQALVVGGVVALLACGGDEESSATATDSDGATTSGGATEGDSTGETTAAADPAEDCPVMSSLGEVSVAGTTPFGDFTGSYAAYGYEAGDCDGSILIAIVSESGPFLEQVSQPADSFFLRPLPFDGVLLSTNRDALGGQVDEELFVKVASGDEYVWGTGAATLTSVDWTPWSDQTSPSDPWPVAEGHFVIDDAGIALEGTFVAPLCGWLAGAC